jgi:hypothetical protein
MFDAGEIEEGFPPFGLPPFSTVSHNKTLYFEDMASKYGTSLISIPFISFLETVATAKSFCEYSYLLSIFAAIPYDRILTCVVKIMIGRLQIEKFRLAGSWRQMKLSNKCCTWSNYCFYSYVISCRDISDVSYRNHYG